MLDKSVPYVEMFMRREGGMPLPEANLPQGYRFSFYQEGDEAHWAAIETSVLEFSTPTDALAYYQKNFLPDRQELGRRCLFVETDAGEKVATASAWWRGSGEERVPWVHWISVTPSHQGKGLGKVVTAKVINHMVELEGDRDMYLHTQTWSHKAVRLYESLGFRITDEARIGGEENPFYEKAVAVLRNIYGVGWEPR